LLFINTILGSIVFIIPSLISKKHNNQSKLTAYECGFNPFEDSRTEFDIKFYIVAILFIIFDLEISFVFPYISCLNTINTIGTYAMLMFLVVLTIGFVYE
jgi:NADH-quinone oxidoreductase subunit A